MSAGDVSWRPEKQGRFHDVGFDTPRRIVAAHLARRFACCSHRLSLAPSSGTLPISPRACVHRYLPLSPSPSPATCSSLTR
ncbi:RING-type domain-containing protein [Psidium guajava]|nr:RING-type domain-containing protein [Psidium guajava]